MVSSREKILKISRDLVKKHGWAGVNIRSLASSCGMSVGSIYNYFGSKTELVRYTIESVWDDIFSYSEKDKLISNLNDFIIWIYKRIEYSVINYPNFFTLDSITFLNENINNVEKKLKKNWIYIKNKLNEILNSDSEIPNNIFNESFTTNNFSDFIFSYILSSLIQSKYYPFILLEIINKILYGQK